MDTFQLKGRLTVVHPPTSTDPSGDFDISAEILERLAVSRRLATAVVLAADPAETLNMADITSAAIVMIKADHPITVAVTTTAGAAQVIGGVTFWFVRCADAPITAITLQRAAGTLTTCRVVLAEV